MKILSRWKSSVFVMGIAAFLLAFTGSMSSASAASTFWWYKSKYSGGFITASPTTSNVWMESTITGAPTSIYQQWNWLSASAGVDGFHQLQNRGNGLCLMSDDASARNAVWMSECDSSKTGQFWGNNTSTVIESLYWFNTLRVSPESAAIYSSYALDDYNIYGISRETHSWTASHD
jgi:hypothetical protein